MTRAPKTRRVWLLRHGATPLNEEGRICGHSDIELSDSGELQARRAADLLAGAKVRLLLSSPIRRTLQTARIVAEPHGLEPEIDEGLTELRLEGWAGHKRTELQGDPAWERWLEAPHETATPEGERLVDVQTRAMASLRHGLSCLEAPGGLIIVSHAGVIRVLVLALLGMPLGDYQKVSVSPGSICSFRLTPGGDLARFDGLNLGAFPSR